VETILLVFAGYAEHANFVFTPSTREAFADELSGFRTGKGSVQLPHTDLRHLRASWTRPCTEAADLMGVSTGHVRVGVADCAERPVVLTPCHS
jgi:hypothetical protein